MVTNGQPNQYQLYLITKEKYQGGIINENQNGICWPQILTNRYPDRKKRK